MPVLLLMAALGALLLAAPAAAQDGQEADISQSCNAGDADGNGSGDSGSGDSGDCGNQRRVVQQNAGGDVSRSINQTQTFGDGDSVRTSDDDEEDRDRDDEEAEDFEAQDDGASAASDDFDCEDFSSQADAQAVLDEDSSDPFNLDGDGDDRACEEEFGQAVRGAPEGGIETGGGGTLTPQLARAEDEPGAAVETARSQARSPSP